MIKSLQPDVVILDIRLDYSNGIDVGKAISTIAPDTKTLVFTAYDDDQCVSNMVRLGISGYLLKTSSAEELRAAIYDVAKGQLTISSEIGSKVLKLLKSNRDGISDKGRPSNLTPREREILTYIGKGLKDKDIAEILGISFRTVETYVRNLSNKLGVSSRTQATLKSVNREA